MNKPGTRTNSQVSDAASGAEDAPTYLDLVPPADAEDRPPQTVNFVNVHGEGDVFALDFFYVHPGKVARIFEGGTPGPSSRREGDTVVHEAEPVARLVLPLTTATELVTELIERVGAGVPHLRGVLSDFGARLHELSHEGLGDEDDESDHDHDHDDDDDDDDARSS